ncbi:hypothetical protein CBE37_02255 [bacterium TMED277]|jgi:hypothetical protein|nr:MAG: hypothetical protein CBE37_02255 [bacterium TMED277]
MTKITNPDVSGIDLEKQEVVTEADVEIVEKRNIRQNLLLARKKQLQRKKRGYGKLPSSLRR